MLGDIHLVGLAADQNAVLNFDFVSDTLVLELTESGQGGGMVEVNLFGEELAFI